MRTLVVAAVILSTVFMQEASGSTFLHQAAPKGIDAELKEHVAEKKKDDTKQDLAVDKKDDQVNDKKFYWKNVKKEVEEREAKAEKQEEKKKDKKDDEKEEQQKVKKEDKAEDKKDAKAEKQDEKKEENDVKAEKKEEKQVDKKDNNNDAKAENKDEKKEEEKDVKAERKEEKQVDKEDDNNDAKAENKDEKKEEEKDVKAEKKEEKQVDKKDAKGQDKKEAKPEGEVDAEKAAIVNEAIVKARAADAEAKAVAAKAASEKAAVVKAALEKTAAEKALVAKAAAEKAAAEKAIEVAKATKAHDEALKKMSETNGAPSQGFNEHSSKIVEHTDMKTMSSDWGGEWPQTDETDSEAKARICRTQTTQSKWCKDMGYASLLEAESLAITPMEDSYDPNSDANNPENPEHKHDEEVHGGDFFQTIHHSFDDVDPSTMAVDRVSSSAEQYATNREFAAPHHQYESVSFLQTSQSSHPNQKSALEEYQDEQIAEGLEEAESLPREKAPESDYE